MTRQRTASIARGLASLVLLGLLLIGPPLALAALVGWPLPTEIPDVASLEQAIRSGVNDDIIVKALALVGWLAWAQIAASIAMEVVAVLRGRPSIQLPVLPGFQAIAGRLVASIAMMTATFSPATAMAAAAPPVPVVAFAAPAAPVAVPPPSWAATTAPDAGPIASPLGADPPATVTVERHDSYWAIAERTLGDGYRWREIRDLNVGRTMNTGDVVMAGSDLVHPGWVLELPGGAASPSTRQVETVDSTPVAAELTVEPGDSFWELAEEQLEEATGHLPTDAETAPYWQDMVEANQDRLVQPGNPNLIVPGQELCVPPVPGVPAGGPTAPPAVVEAMPEPPAEQPVPAPSPAHTTLPAEPVAEAPAAPTVPDASTPASPAASDSESVPVPAIAAAGLASAALAVGATRAVRRRRRQAGHRSPLSRPGPSEGDALAVHRELLANADDVAVDDLRRCLGELAQALATTGCEARPRIVQHGPEHLDVFLYAPSDDAPEGWRAEADGAVWTRRAPTIGGEDADTICAAPLLVTIGEPDEGGQIYLDLEADGVVSLTGDMVTARAVARSILTELAFTPLADTLEVLVVGDLAPPDAKALDHVTLADTWDDVRDDLAAWAEQSHQVLVDKGWPNSFLARGAEPYHDALAPVAVIAHEPPPADLLDVMLAHRPATLVVVALGEMQGATVIECAPDSLTLPDLGLVCTPHPLEAEALDAIIDLVESADDPGTPVDDPGVPDEGQLSLLALPVVVEPNTAGPDLEAMEEPDFDVLVRALGEIRVEGGDPLGPKQTAVVAYIALHGTVSADRLEEAVWASTTGTSRRKRLANTISECRALLGRRHLPAAADGRYHAGPGLMTDLELFDRRIGRAADQPPTESADTLLMAMGLVTGKLFNYRNSDRSSFSWVDLENWVSIWELKVAAVAQKCADLLLDLGRTEEAVEVALHALGIIPTHTALTETLMRAHAANGDRLAVQRVYEEHLGALETLDLDDAEDSTTELCERLLSARAG